MAEDALSLSLDDIIKRNAESKKKSSGGGSARRGGRGGSRGGRGSSSAARPLGVQNRGVTKTISNRGRGQGRGASRGASRGDRGSFLRDAPRDLDAVEGNKAWTHDMYSQIARPAPRRPVQQQAVAPSAAEGTRLEVSNLDHVVTDNDIKELFSACGELKKWGVQHNNSGNHLGTAFVIFKKPIDAERALEQYNGVALDGKPMNVRLDDSLSTLASGIRVGGAHKLAPSSSGRLVQQNQLFKAAAGDARIGSNRPYGGMRSTVGRMEED